MAGQQTNGFDMVIELTETAFRDVIATELDTNNTLCDILANSGPLPAALPCGPFSVDVRFDRPTDVNLPAAATNVVDITIHLGENGNQGQMRLVPEASIDRPLPDLDLVCVDFRDGKLHHASLTIRDPMTGNNVNVPADQLRDHMENTVGFLPILPVAVNRATTDPKVIRSAEVKIIDDRGGADADACAVMLTYGGGTPGNAAGFTSGFVPAGFNGVFAVFFEWICRLIGPQIEQSLGLNAGDFRDCRLQREVTIDEDEDVILTSLELSLRDNFIEVRARVRKSGFCYTAHGTVAGRIGILVQNGQLALDPQIEDPEVDVDVPAICWLVAIAVGVITGIIVGILTTLLTGVIVGLIVGGVLVLLLAILHLLFGDIADTVQDALDSISATDVNIPLVPVNINLADAIIDDILLVAQVEPKDIAPICSEGTLVLQNGQFIDLDTGEVGGEDLPGVDLAWQGAGLARRLRTTCSSALARTGSRKKPSRPDLYRLLYLSPEFVPVDELGITVDVPFFPDRFVPTLFYFGVRTNERRYARVRVVEVKDGFIRLEYRTYENFRPSVRIVGQFKCDRPVLATSDVLYFQPGATVPDDLDDPAPVLQPALAATPATAQLGFGARNLHGLVPEVSVATPATKSRVQRVFSSTLVDLGGWGTTFRFDVDRGRFDARTDGLTGPLSFEWTVDGKTLVGNSGSVNAKGVVMTYTVNGERLVLEPKRGSAVEFEIAVAVTDANDVKLRTSRCVKYVPECTKIVPVIPVWAEFRKAALAQLKVTTILPQPSGKPGDGLV